MLSEPGPYVDSPANLHRTSEERYVVLDRIHPGAKLLPCSHYPGLDFGFRTTVRAVTSLAAIFPSDLEVFVDSDVALFICGSIFNIFLNLAE